MRGFGHTAAASALALLTAAAPASAVQSFFHVLPDSETVAGPPYPTGCHVALVAHEVPGGFECDGQLAIGIRRAVDCEGSVNRSSLLRVGDHSPGDWLPDSLRFNAMCLSPPDGGTAPSGIEFALFLELTAGGVAPGELVAVDPERHVRDPLRYFDIQATGQSVVMLCLVEFGTGVHHELTFTVEPTEPATLTAALVRVLPQVLGGGGRADPAEPGSYFTARPDAMFDIALVLNGVPEFDGAEPLMSITVRGRFLGGVSPVEATTWGAIKTLYRD